MQKKIITQNILYKALKPYVVIKSPFIYIIITGIYYKY